MQHTNIVETFGSHVDISENSLQFKVEQRVSNFSSNDEVMFSHLGVFRSLCVRELFLFPY